MSSGNRGQSIVSVNLTIAARDMLKQVAAHRKITMATAAELVIRAEWQRMFPALGLKAKP